MCNFYPPLVTPLRPASGKLSPPGYAITGIASVRVATENSTSSISASALAPNTVSSDTSRLLRYRKLCAGWRCSSRRSS